MHFILLLTTFSKLHTQAISSPPHFIRTAEIIFWAYIFLEFKLFLWTSDTFNLYFSTYKTQLEWQFLFSQIIQISGLQLLIPMTFQKYKISLTSFWGTRLDLGIFPSTKEMDFQFLHTLVSQENSVKFFFMQFA